MNDVITDKYTLLYGDCLERMAYMGDGSVDLTVTSPPYDNLRTYEGSLEWGEHVWKPVLAELYRLTKDGGVVVWVVGDATIDGSETGTSFRQAMYAVECGFNLNDTMIFIKKSPMPSDTRRCRYTSCFEYMFVFSKGKPFAWNPIMVRCETTGMKSGGFNTYRSDGTRDEKRTAARQLQKVNDTRPLTNVWTYRLTGPSVHPARYPGKLAIDHIISWSNEGDTVFDPFTGSGTTGVAAMNMGRKFMGCEKVDKYFTIAEQRIADAANTLF